MYQYTSFQLDRKIKYQHLTGIKLRNLWSEVLKTPTRKNERLYANELAKRIGYVYLFQLGQYPFYKIGLSVNPDQRIKEPLGIPELVALCLPSDLSIVHLIETNYMQLAETEIQLRYYSNNIDLEWFHLSEQDVEAIKGIPFIYYNLGFY